MANEIDTTGAGEYGLSATDSNPAVPYAVDTPESGNVNPTSEGDASTTGPAGQREDNTPPWLKAEVTKERNRRRAAEEERARLADQVERLSKALGDRAEPPSGKPRRDAFLDPDEYEAAHEAWLKDQIKSEFMAEINQQREQQARAAALSEQQKAWLKQDSTGRAKYPDFAEVAYNQDLMMSDVMTQAILESDVGYELAYHLGSNPDETARIAGLSPVKQAIEIGKIASSLNAPRPVSKAPAPIKPLGSASKAMMKAPAEMSEAEYFAHRSAEAKANRERLFG